MATPVLSHKSNSRFAHLLFCLLKLVTAGLSQFADTTIFICENHIMKWQLIELSFFTPIWGNLVQIIIEELPHYPPGKDIRTACVKLKLQCHFFEHRSWQLVASITVCSGLYHVPPCCTVVTWLFLPLFCKLIDGWECFTALDVSITQHSASCRIIMEELLGGWMSGEWTDTLTWLN